LYSSLNIITAFKSRRVRWAGHVTRICSIRNAYKILVRKTEGRIHFGDISVDRRIIKLNLKMGMKPWTGFSCLRTETSGGFL